MEGGGEGVEVIAATTNASFECASVLVGNDKEHQEIANFDANTLLEEQTEWRTISQRFPCTISPGATCSVLPCAGGPDKDTGMYDEENNDRVLFIGGKSASNRGLYLDVLVFSFKDFSFCPQFIETNRVINRIGHSCISYENRVLCFGGASTQTGMSLGQVVSVEVNDFGVKSQLISYNEGISGVGLSSELYGMNKDQVIIFGGFSKETYSNALTKFRPHCDVPTEDRFVAVEVADATVEKPHPAARAYHSSAICGSKNQFLVVVGGQTKNGSLLNDVWVIDLSKCDDANSAEEEEVDPKAKKPPPKKVKQGSEDEDAHACHWHKIEVSDPEHSDILTRSLHSACKLPSNASSEGVGDVEDAAISIAIFNGISKYGLPIVCGYRLDIDMTSFTLTACDVIAKKEACTYLPGATSVLEKNANGCPSTIAVISANFLHYLSLDALSGISTTLLNMTSNEREIECLHNKEKEKYQVEHTTPSQQSYDSGDKYEGEMIQDPNTDHRSFVRHGQGKMQYASGMTYIGHWNMGCKHGIGEITFPSGLGSYEGEFSNDAMEGKGKIRLVPGCMENGQIINFLSDLYANVNDGFTYTGDFCGSKLHGQGTLETSKGEKYKGCFVEGEISGMGVLEGKDGSRYSGRFVSGLKNDDDATLIYSDGSKYEGAFRSGKRNGHGVLTSNRGKIIYKGKWVGDKFCGKGEWNTPTNERYVGIFEEGCPSGLGTLYHCNGAVHMGEFRNGKKEGMGKTVYADGSIEEGAYSRDKFVVL